MKKTLLIAMSITLIKISAKHLIIGVLSGKNTG
jgi:hypothetical protein